MGMIGRWIDGLTDEQRDGVIEHPDPTYAGESWWDPALNCGCLVGCVVARDTSAKQRITEMALDGVPLEHAVGDLAEEGFDSEEEYPWGFNTKRSAYGLTVGDLFPEMCARFTPERMWRVVKARAAKANRIEVGTREAVVT